MRRKNQSHQKYIFLGKISSNKKYNKFQVNNQISNQLMVVIIFIKIMLILILLRIFVRLKINERKNKTKKISIKNYTLLNQLRNNYVDNSFIILSHICPDCGLLSHYNKFLSCLSNILKEGRIPIVNLIRFPNIFNGFNESSLSLEQNPWEYFFKQPFNYTLKQVKTFSKHIKDYECCGYKRPSQDIIFNNKFYRYYWNNLYSTYFPIKDEIIKEADIIKKELFSKSENVLGILLRGTDFIALKPKKHYIQPEPEIVFSDVDKFEQENNYDFYFLVTEDKVIRNKFINRYKNKLKYLKSNETFNYEYNDKEILANNKKINGNLKLMKEYLINIIILSKCIDIICGRTNGSVLAFIISKGFRNIKAYDFGKYK